jgi:glycosyltransferase involved in cell wall biosynthesis
MKILLTSGIYPPDIGGPASYIPKLSRSFRSEGHQTTVVSLMPRTTGEINRDSETFLVHRGFLPVRILKTISQIVFRAIFVDRIFSNGLYLESAIAARILGKPSVAKIVGDPLWERKRNNGKTDLSIVEFQTSQLTFLDKCFRYIYRFALDSFSVITTPSEELARVVQGWGVKPQVIVIPNGVEIPDRIPAEKKYDLVYVGRLVKWKNVDIVIELTSQLGLRTAIIGSGPELMSLRDFALRLDANCDFLGEQEKDEIDQTLMASRLFVLLSQYEGLSFALLESMAAGITPIVSDAKGNLDVVTDGFNSLVAHLDNLQELPNQLQALLDDEPRMRALGDNALQTVKKKYLASSRISDMIELTLSAR